MSSFFPLESALNGLQGRRQNRDREPYKTKVADVAGGIGKLYCEEVAGDYRIRSGCFFHFIIHV